MAAGKGLLTLLRPLTIVTDRSVSKKRRRINPMNRAAIVLLALLMLLLGCSRPAPDAEPVRAVRTLKVGAGAEGSTLDYAGEVRARTESRLSFRVAGKMVSREVNAGDTVTAGQVLARLDPQDLRFGQQAARSAVEAAQVNADQAAADFKRFRELRDQGFISAAELDRRESTLKAAQAQLAQARAQAGVQNNQARYSALVADVGGVVTAVEAEPGAVLAAGTPVLRLAHDGPRDVVFSVPEQQAGGLRALEGQAGALRVQLWGVGEAPVAATVREVAAAADPVTRTFVVKADIGSDARIRLGQTATVMLPLPARPGVLALPLAAVFEHQGKSSVWLLDTATMTVRAQPVEVAGAEGNRVLIASGLSAGQTVVSAGVHTLTPGQKVALYAAGAASAASSTATTSR
jgi:multidrug efflux system membrane fusion protein